MTYFYYGALKSSGGRVFDQTAKEILEKHGFDEEIGFCVHEDVISVDGGMGGGWESALREAFADLFAAGYPCEGYVTYDGDYRGAYEVRADGTFIAYEEYDWIIHNASDEELMREMTRRGFLVSGKTDSAHDCDDAENVCPVCNHEGLDYLGDRHCDESGTITSWTCPSCGASGEETTTDRFDRHYNVRDADGNSIHGRPE